MYSDIFDGVNYDIGKSNLYCFQNCPIAGICSVQDLHTNMNISKLRMYAENNNNHPGVISADRRDYTIENS